MFIDVFFAAEDVRLRPIVMLFVVNSVVEPRFSRFL